MQGRSWFAVPPCFPPRGWAAHGSANGLRRLRLKDITAATLFWEEKQVSRVWGTPLVPARSQRTLALWRMTYVLPSCLPPKYITGGIACGAIDECISSVRRPAHGIHFLSGLTPWNRISGRLMLFSINTKFIEHLWLFFIWSYSYMWSILIKGFAFQSQAINDLPTRLKGNYNHA